MSLRVCFYQAEGLDSGILAKIIAKARTELFNSRSNAGFLIEKSSKDVFSGRYVEKVTVSEVVVDPFGKEKSFARVDFKISKFDLRVRPSGLIAYSPFSLVKTLVGRLSEFSDFSFSLTPVSIPLEKVTGECAKVFGGLRVYAVSADDYRIDNTTVAKLHFESSDDVRKHLPNFIKSRGVQYTSIKAEFEFLGSIRRCEIKSSGVMAIFGEPDAILAEKLLNIVERLCLNDK